MGMKLPDSKLQKLMILLDADNTGQVELAEFLMVLGYKPKKSEASVWESTVAGVQSIAKEDGGKEDQSRAAEATESTAEDNFVNRTNGGVDDDERLQDDQAGDEREVEEDASRGDGQHGGIVHGDHGDRREGGVVLVPHFEGKPTKVKRKRKRKKKVKVKEQQKEDEVAVEAGEQKKEKKKETKKEKKKKKKTKEKKKKDKKRDKKVKKDKKDQKDDCGKSTTLPSTTDETFEYAGTAEQNNAAVMLQKVHRQHLAKNRVAQIYAFGVSPREHDALMEIFSTVDTNNTGSVDKYEWFQALKRYVRPPSKEGVGSQQLLRALLGASDLPIIVRSVIMAPTIHPEVFLDLDTKVDGWVSVSELFAFAFSRIDENGKAYTMVQFGEFYGSNGLSKWETAARIVEEHLLVSEYVERKKNEVEVVGEVGAQDEKEEEVEEEEEEEVKKEGGEVEEEEEEETRNRTEMTTKIQSLQRGRATRKKTQEKLEKERASKKIQAVHRGNAQRRLNKKKVALTGENNKKEEEEEEEENGEEEHHDTMMAPAHGSEEHKKVVEGMTAETQEGVKKETEGEEEVP